MGLPRGHAAEDEFYMRRALQLARRGFGATSPNPMVGAVLVQDGRVIGEGWHERAGAPHAEVNALTHCQALGFSPVGATLYVTLEPCSTHGRTPPCTQAVLQAGIRRVIVATTDPNPRHSGRGLRSLEDAGLEVQSGLLEEEANELNEAFNYWIVHRQPFVLLKSAMTLDGKIATNSGESKWITSLRARAWAMRARIWADAILVGVNTVIRDDPALTLRRVAGVRIPPGKQFRRIVLDPRLRIPLSAQVLCGDRAAQTIVVGSTAAPAKRIQALEKKTSLLLAPEKQGEIDLKWLMKSLGAREITALLVEGGGETIARFLQQKLGNRALFFYAPKVFGGRAAPKAVGGEHSFASPAPRLEAVQWGKLGPDLFLNGLLNFGAR